MKNTRHVGPDSLTGLRTRYSPGSRINRGLISMGPWIDTVLLVLMFALFEGTYVLRPGVVVELPEAAFTDGTHASVMAVVLSVGGRGKTNEEIVFFDDERFRVGVADDLVKLSTGFAERARQHPDEALVIQADAGVNHGTVMLLVDMASKVGIKQINMAHKAP